MPNFLELRGLKSRDIVMDAQFIKAVPINDTEKADEKVLAYDQAEAKLAYVPKCPEVLLKAIQHVTISMATGELTHQVLINQVDMDNTFLIYGGANCTGLYPWISQAHLQLTDSTHILATRGQTGHVLTLSVFVIECTAGINSIQRGIITFDGNLTEDDTINAVDTDKTFISYLGFKAETNEWNKSLIRFSLIDSTTIRAHVSTAAGWCKVSYEVVEFI